MRHKKPVDSPMERTQEVEMYPASTSQKRRPEDATESGISRKRPDPRTLPPLNTPYSTMGGCFKVNLRELALVPHKLQPDSPESSEDETETSSESDIDPCAGGSSFIEKQLSLGAVHRVVYRPPSPVDNHGMIPPPNTPTSERLYMEAELEYRWTPKELTSRLHACTDEMFVDESTLDTLPPEDCTTSSDDEDDYPKRPYQYLRRALFTLRDN